MNKKIFLIEAGLGGGGGQQVFLEMVRSLSMSSWAVSCLISETSYLERELQNLSVQVVKTQALIRHSGLMDRLIRNYRYFIALWRCKDLVRQSKWVVVNDPDFFLPAVLISCLTGSRSLILYAHLVYQGIQLKFFRALSKCSCVHSIWCSSYFLKDHIFSEDTVQAKSMVMEPPCRFPTRLPQMFNQPWTFASIGLLHPDKGHDVLVRFAKKFSDRNFYLIGPESPHHLGYFQVLKENAPSNLIFAGYVHDLEDFLRIKAIGGVIQASRNNHESFGMSCVEATALGCTAIVRSTGGLKEISRNLDLASGESDDELIELMSDQIDNSSIEKNVILSQKKLESFYGKDAFNTRLLERLA
jgi:glycosyltransferase involved in cell wall biosynthesis